MKPGGVFTIFIAGSTFDQKLGMFLINELSNNPYSYTHTNFMVRLIGESRGILNQRHIEFVNGKWAYTFIDRLANKDTLDKSLYVRNWVEQNKSKFTPQEYQAAADTADGFVKFYS